VSAVADRVLVMRSDRKRAVDGAAWAALGKRLKSLSESYFSDCYHDLLRRVTAEEEQAKIELELVAYLARAREAARKRR